MKVIIEVPELGNFTHHAEIGISPDLYPSGRAVEALRAATYKTKYLILRTIAEHGGRARYKDINKVVQHSALNQHLKGLIYLGLVEKTSWGEYALTPFGIAVLAVVSAVGTMEK